MKLKPTNCIICFLASAFQAFGMYNVHALSDITEGGVLGATLLLDHWLSISPAVSGFILTAACFFLGWRTLGQDFIGYSAIAALGFSSGYALFEQFPPLWPEIVSHPFLAAISGALFIGIGAGITIRAGGATTGDDALAMSLSRLFSTPIERIYLITDLSVLLLSLSYIPMQRIGYSLITVILSGQIIGLIQKIPAKACHSERSEES